MKKHLSILALCFILAGCAQYNVTLMSQTNGSMWHGTANEMGKTITIVLKDETYSGTYSFMQNGSVGFGTGFLQGTAGSALANSTYVSSAALGNGSALLTSASGKGLRCQFSYSTMNRSGAGICRDDKKKLYDLQIN